MAVEFINLVRWEWFKLSHRWMPWVLLVLLLLVSQVLLWGSFFVFNSFLQTSGQPALATFALPNSITETLRRTFPVALVLFTLLATSVIGMEYRLGTLRMVLTKGTGRWQYLGGKLTLVYAVVGAALGILVAITAVDSLMASVLAFGWPRPLESGSWGTALWVWVSTWLSLLPFLTMTCLLTVLTRSPSVGVAVGVGYYFTEWVFTGIFGSLFDWSRNLTGYLLVQNMSRLVDGPSWGLQDNSSGLALLVLIVYWLVFSAGAFWIVQHRDVAGASGD